MVAAAAACTPDTAPPTAVPSPAVTASVPAPDGETRTVDAAGDLLTLTMTPLARAGDRVVLTVRARVDHARNGRDALVTSHFATIVGTSFDNVRLVDESSRRVWTVAPRAGGGRCVCTASLRLAPGGTGLLQAVFTGVPATVDRLSVMLPYAGVFTGVPVVAGTPPGDEPPDPAGAGASHVAGLDAWTERLDVPLRTRRTPERVDLELDTDVLFRTDSATLTPAAATAVAAAVADLRDAGPAPLTVTGHTDDTGSATHNQRLSEQRARTVADALRGPLPDARWPKSVAGRGETQPVAPNTSAAGRRLNRRVTVSFRAPAAPPPAPARVALPETTGVRAEAAEGAEIALPLRRGTVRFTARPAERRGEFLLVHLVARNTGADDATILDYLGQGVFTARDEFDPYARYGASGVRLLAGATASYGLDYRTAEGGHRCLCDRLLDRALPPGSERVIALWFPAPPPGVTTAALDVPDRFRLTGLPFS
jgi:outer membrane protein OmpA-like peptidoglycan-associated protein